MQLRRTQSSDEQPRAVDALLEKLRALKGKGHSFFSLLDTAHGVHRIIHDIKKRGVVDKEDIERVVLEALDFGSISSSEREALVDLLHLGGVQFDADARSALALYLGVPDPENSRAGARSIPRSHARDRDYIAQIVAHLAGYKGVAAKVLCGVILCQLFLVLTIEIPRQAIEFLTRGGTGPSLIAYWYPGAEFKSLTVIAAFTGLWCVTLLSSNLAHVWYEVGRKNLGERLVHDFRIAAVGSLFKRSIADVTSVNIGTVGSRLIANPDAVSQLLNDVLLRAIADGLFLCLMFTYLGLLSGYILVATGVFLPLLALAALVVGRRTRSYSAKLNHIREQVNTAIKDALSARREVRIFAAEAAESERFSADAQKLLSAIKSYNLYMSGTTRILVGATELVTAIAFGVGAFLLSKGHTDPATLIAFLLALPHVLLRFTRLAMIIEPYQMTIVPVTNLLDLVNWRADETEICPHPTPADQPPIRRASVVPLVFENCGYRYPDANAAFEFGSLESRAGQLVAIVGESGAGKSTLFMVLMKMLAPYSGTIKILGRSLDEWHRTDLVQHVACMGQDSFLFNRSYRENIAYRMAGRVSDEQIEAVCKRVHIHDDIVGSLGGYDAVVRNHGDNLSGGQRRRIALARALIGNPRVLLLDEPFVGIPAVITRDLLETTRTLATGRVILVATHDPMVFCQTDHIMVFRREATGASGVTGRVVDQGSHAGLLKTCPYYRELVSDKRRGGLPRAHAPASRVDRLADQE